MAVTTEGQKTNVRLILNNGTTETGRVKQLSVNIGGGQEMKPLANYSPSYNVAQAVKTLYSQQLLAVRRRTQVNLINE